MSAHQEQLTAPATALDQLHLFELLQATFGLGAQDAAAFCFAVTERSRSARPARELLPAMTLLQARQDFLEYLGERNRSPLTIKTYRGAIDQLLAFLDAQGTRGDSPAEALSLPLVHAFGRALFLRGLGPGTRYTYLSAVRSWLKRLHALGHSEMDPSAVELPKVPLAAATPDARIPELLSAARSCQTIVQLRDAALLRVLFDTSARVSEVASLDRSRIDFGLGVAVVSGKGDKLRSLFFSPTCLDLIRAYLNARGDDLPALFVGHGRGRCLRLTPRAIQVTVRRYASTLGVEATPHAFRHYGATAMLHAGADIRSVQEVLGHASVATTQRYTHVTPRRLLGEWQRFHPGAQEHKH